MNKYNIANYLNTRQELSRRAHSLISFMRKVETKGSDTPPDFYIDDFVPVIGDSETLRFMCISEGHGFHRDLSWEQLINAEKMIKQLEKDIS